MPFDIDARITEWRKSLLDTTKRNRLIKFVAGRIGGINLVAPKPIDIWTRLVREYGTLTFPWKRDLLGLRARWWMPTCSPRISIHGRVRSIRGSTTWPANSPISAKAVPTFAPLTC